MENPITIMTKSQLQALKDAIADVMCWHNGFECAKPDYNAPPGLYTLQSFGADLQRYIDREKKPPCYP
jgi:hypothetical protein